MVARNRVARTKQYQGNAGSDLSCATCRRTRSMTGHWFPTFATTVRLISRISRFGCCIAKTARDGMTLPTATISGVRAIVSDVVGHFKIQNPPQRSEDAKGTQRIVESLRKKRDTPRSFEYPSNASIEFADLRALRLSGGASRACVPIPGRPRYLGTLPGSSKRCRVVQ